MKKLILTLALILCGYAISNASILTKQSVELAVGSNPVSILENPSDGMIHIFCAGIDANNNNAFDEGEDEKPSWWTYNPAGSSVEPTMVKEFDNYFVSPFKPSIIIAEGEASFGIPFKSAKVGDNFTGEAKFEIYEAKTLNILSSEMLFESELLFKEYNKFHTISIIRKNGNDLLNITSNGTVYIDPIVLKGDIIDFVTFTDDDDNKFLAPVIFDGEKSTIVVFDISPESGVKKLFEQDLTHYGVKKDSLTSITTDGERLFLTTSSYDLASVLSINKDKDGFFDLQRMIDDVRTSNNYIISLADDIHLVNKGSKDLTVINLNVVYDRGNIEMHHSKFDVGYMYSTGQQVYCASKKSNEKKGGQISIYDFTNEPKKDAAQIDMGYTGYQPLDFFPYGESLNFRYYNISLGIDYNFDGVINEDEGDLPPSVWASSIRGFGTLLENAELKLNFNFPINFPLNTNISSDGDIPLPSGNMVNFYNVKDNEVYDSFDAEMYVSTAFRVLDYLVLGQRDMEENKSYIRIKKGDFIDVKTEVGANVVDCIVYQNAAGFGVVSLSEGNFGQPDAKINILKLSTMGFGDNKEVAVGTGGSSIVINAEQTLAAIVMNGSHEIHILDLLTDEILNTFSTGTSGYGGPRDAKFVGDLLYVTTYSNKILLFDSKTGKELSSITVDGLTEGLAITDKYLLAANINYSDYSPSNRIFAYDLDKITSVESQIPTKQTIRVYPNPVSNDFHLVSDDLAGTNDIAIINSQGKIVATHSGSSNGAIALNADALGLVAGNYTAVINGTRAVRFVVIK